MSVQNPLQVVNIPWRNNNLSLMSRDPPLSDQGETIIGVYLLILGWLSWFGNSIVIFVLFKQRSSLQPTDYLTLNLAVSDASISVFGYSRGILEIFNVFRDNGYLITSVWTLVGFATLLFGCRSLRKHKCVCVFTAHCITSATVLMCVIFIWTGALFWSGAPILGWGSYTGQSVKGLTVRRRLLKSTSLLYFCQKDRRPLEMCFSNALSAERDLTDRQRKIERDVTVVSVVICTAFILAWSPYAVVSMWSAWGFHVPSLTSIFTGLFAKSASFYNPLIYFGLSSKFRRDVSVLLPCGGEAKDAVKLKRFKEVKGKADGVGLQRFRADADENRDLHKNEKKYHPANPAPSPDSGVGSHQETPPPAGKQVFFINAPEPSDTPESECIRL
uniref:Opsin 6, group member a n=1 Tax=Sinocyclocheilus anshuiensis TaxID=1608454 RepID=A0A671LY47_9TELE